MTMTMIFNSNRIIEKDYKEKQYFSDRPSAFLGVKFYSCVFVFMFVLFSMNLYQSISQVSVIHTFF